MSVNYASGLSEYDNKGVCGLPEVFDDPNDVELKVKQLSQLICESKSVVIHCGAGISTSAGIPDFRGPKGIWTLESLKSKVKDEIKEENGSKSQSLSFNDAKPTYTHMALIALIKSKHIKFIISQNIDGLFLKGNISRKFIAELHGNFFLDQCNICKSKFIRNNSSETMGLKLSNRKCLRKTRPCRGYLQDTILDWEDELPKDELRFADKYSRQSNLSICLGTTLQIQPAASLPFLSKKLNNGKVVIINLQPTKFDSKADLVIHDYVDNIMMLLCKELNVKVDDYDVNNDPTINQPNSQWKR